MTKKKFYKKNEEQRFMNVFENDVVEFDDRR